MIKAREWPVRAMYILIAAALALSLFITAAPTHNVSAANNTVKAEWTRVDTPTTENYVVAPESVIIDYALASDGGVTYAVAWDNWTAGDYVLLKSTDGAATWTDITDKLVDALDTRPYQNINRLLRVETDDTDPDFVAVALVLNVSVMTPVHVFFSTDGGTTFNDAGEVVDGGIYITLVSDIEVSPEAAGKRDIAVLGESNKSPGAGLFRCTVKGDMASAWEDATAYDGWDNVFLVGDDPTDNLDSWIVIEGEFSPNWATDKTFLVTTIENAPSDFYVNLQSGSWGTTAGWNKKSTLGIAAVRVSGDVNMPTYLIGTDARGLAGLTLPSDYNSKSTDTRVLWVWFNYYAPGSYPANKIMRVDNDSADPVVQQVKNGELFLTNVSYYGTTAEGEALAGVLGTGSDYGGWPNLFTNCCEGVQVYRNTGIHNMDICCERWKKACKPPTGVAAMAVSLVSADKAYAVALQGDPRLEYYDEGAWSVTFDGGDTWNQLSLVDTDINYLSDVAVSPDCNKMMLVTVNYDDAKNELCTCDSVWLKATSLPEAQEYSGKWLRTWCGGLTGTWFEYNHEAGFLRLPLTETTGDTVYLVDYGTSNVYRNDLETLGCWTPIASTTLTNIVDLVAKDADTLYALDYNGDVSMYDSEGWHEAVDSKLNSYGWSIAVHGDYVLVGGMYYGEVAYSDDGGKTFTHLKDKNGNDATTPIEGHTTVAFDTYFDTNNIIYAAIEGWGGDNSNGGIYRWALGTSGDWEDTGARHDFGYTGLVLSYLGGNTHTSAATGGVLYASYKGDYCAYSVSPECSTEMCWQTGVARSLNPAETIECTACVEWDYLTVGLDSSVGFQATPDALKICGCLDPSTNSKLFAIDSWAMYKSGYDIDAGQEGTVWTFEDCYAKKAPTITSPTGNTTIPADPCSCYNAPFGITWDGLCDACHYEIQFALDKEFTTVWDTVSAPRAGSKIPTSYLVEGGVTGEGLSCETVYYLRVRAYQAGTCQVIHSWWSDPLKITIAPSVGAAAIDLVSPASGASDVAIKNVGFSWDLTAAANKFDWVLSKNADLSSALESKTGLTSKAYACTKTLDYGTSYYWQVIAYKDGAILSTSAVGTFTTAAHGAFCCPIDGLCFDTQAALEAHNAAAHPAPGTPMWVWIVIAIGAVLVIVVIVLIFRTRRV